MKKISLGIKKTTHFLNFINYPKNIIFQFPIKPVVKLSTFGKMLEIDVKSFDEKRGH